MKVALFFDKMSEGTVGIYIEKALKDSEIEYTHFWTKDASLIKPEFDLYLRIDHGDYKYDLPDYLRPKAFWAMDTHLEKPFKKIIAQAKNYDFVFCTFEKEGAEKLKKFNIDSHIVPFACDPQIHKKQEVKKIYDIGFVGTDGKERRKYLIDELRKRYPNSFIGRADYRNISKIYSQSKIGFNYSLTEKGCKAGCNMRFFEIMSCGAMLLNNPIEDCSIETLGFKKGRDLVIYESDEKLFELIDYYLNNEQERERIAESGYRLTISNHTYKNRIGQIFDIIREGLIDKYRGLKI